MSRGVEKTALQAASLFGLILCVLTGIWAWQAGLLTSQERLQAFVASCGAAGGLLFVAFQMVQVVVPVLPGGLGCLVGVVLFGLFAAATVIYLCTMLYVFPYALRRELPLLATVKNAFYIGMRHLPVTLLILAINVGLIVLCLNFAVLFAALPGVMGWADALCMRRLLNRYAPPPSEGEA